MAMGTAFASWLHNPVQASPWIVSIQASGPAQPVGTVETVDGQATATRADGTVATLAVGTAIYQGDAIATAAGGAVSVVFVDGTTFALGEDARMIVDELVYDPDGNGDSAAFNLVQGAFLFVSGDIAHAGEDAMTLTTPVATIGIRGTALALEVGGEGAENLIGLLREDDGTVGEVTVATDVGTVILDEANEATTMTSRLDEPALPEIVPAEQLQEMFGALLDQLTGVDIGDDGPQEGEDGAEGEPQDEASDIPEATDDAAVLGQDDTTLAPLVLDTGIVVSEVQLGVFTDAQIGIVTDDDGVSHLRTPIGDLTIGTDNVFEGGSGNDFFNGGSGSDFGRGNGGDDHLNGNGGNDTLRGGPGDDVIFGGDGDDQLDGDDRLTTQLGGDGGEGDDAVHGDDGNDFIVDGGGNDILIGGSGDDTFLLGPPIGAGVGAQAAVVVVVPENNLVEGGTGIDTVLYLGAPTGVAVILEFEFASLAGGAGFDQLSDVENIVGSVFSDDITGSLTRNALDGSEGNDVLTGGADTDFLTGGGGSDAFFYGADEDIGFVALNEPRGDTLGDIIEDFEPGIDQIFFDPVQFDPNGDYTPGPLIDGVNFTVIDESFSGVLPLGAPGAIQTNHSEGNPIWVFSTVDNALFYDDNGIANGYSVVADMSVAPASSDIFLGTPPPIVGLGS